MNTSSSILNCPIGNELSRMIEPLASYICATEKPTSALESVLELLLREVKATNTTAIMHFRSFLHRRW